MLPVHSLEQPLGCREGKWSVDSIEPSMHTGHEINDVEIRQ